jgi:hypothetical protein
MGINLENSNRERALSQEKLLMEISNMQQSLKEQNSLNMILHASLD